MIRTASASRALLPLTAAAGLLLTTACGGSGGDGGGRPDGASGGAEAVKVGMTPVGRTTGAAPGSPITLKVTGGDGILADVTVTDQRGQRLDGTLSADNRSWTSRTATGPSSTYKIGYKARAKDGGERSASATITTAAPEKPNKLELQPGNRSTVGVAQPLTWEELALSAMRRGETMRWETKHDRDAFKEVWLLFNNDQGRFPLYPGESVWIEYAYSVGDQTWGRWFQRAVRLPTEHLEVQLAFPAALDPVVWGTETSMTAEASPLRTAPVQRETRLFSWTTSTPTLHARYRLELRFRAKREHDTTHEEFR